MWKSISIKIKTRNCTANKHEPLQCPPQQAAAIAELTRDTPTEDLLLESREAVDKIQRTTDLEEENSITSNLSMNFNFLFSYEGLGNAYDS